MKKNMISKLKRFLCICTTLSITLCLSACKGLEDKKEMDNSNTEQSVNNSINKTIQWENMMCIELLADSEDEINETSFQIIDSKEKLDTILQKCKGQVCTDSYDNNFFGNKDLILVEFGANIDCTYELNSMKQLGKNLSVEDVVKPTINKDQTIGTDVCLDYEGNDIIIFHGYFGLFVYNTEEQKMLKMLDLESLDCDMMQGDSYCQVLVSEDGKEIYLCPLENNEHKEMYVYKWNEELLYKAAYDVSDKVIYDKNKEGALKGYLEIPEDTSGTIGDLKYIVKEKEVWLFD